MRSDRINKDMPFHNHVKSFGDLCKEFKFLPEEEKNKYEHQWLEKRKKYCKEIEQLDVLDEYNKADFPLFKQL